MDEYIQKITTSALELAQDLKTTLGQLRVSLVCSGAEDPQLNQTYMLEDDGCSSANDTSILYRFQYS